jgi:sensor domain CHASE-containing protein
METEAIVALFAGSVTMVGALTTAIVQLVHLRREQVKQSEKIEVVHELVNSRLTTVLERVEQLTKTLDHAGVEVPPELPTSDQTKE